MLLKSHFQIVTRESEALGNAISFEKVTEECDLVFFFFFQKVTIEYMIWSFSASSECYRRVNGLAFLFSFYKVTIEYTTLSLSSPFKNLPYKYTTLIFLFSFQKVTIEYTRDLVLSFSS